MPGYVAVLRPLAEFIEYFESDRRPSTNSEVLPRLELMLRQYVVDVSPLVYHVYRFLFPPPLPPLSSSFFLSAFLTLFLFQTCL